MNQSPDKKEIVPEPAWVRDLYLKTMMLDSDEKPKLYTILYARMNDTSFITAVNRAEDTQNIYERCYKLLSSGVDLVKVTIKYKNQNEIFSEFIVKGTDTYMPLADEKPQGNDYLNGLGANFSLQLDARDMKHEIKSLTEKLSDKNDYIEELKKEVEDLTQHQDRQDEYIRQLENGIREKDGGSEKLLNMGLAMLGGRIMGYDDNKIMSLAGIALGSGEQVALPDASADKGGIAVEEENLSPEQKSRKKDELIITEFISKLPQDDFLKLCAIIKGFVNLKVPFDYMKDFIQKYKTEENA